MASLSLTTSITSIKDVEAYGVHLIATLSGDESNQKQRILIPKKGSKDPRSGNTFEFNVGDFDARLKFKLIKYNIFGFKKVMGKVDVPVMDLLAPVVHLLANGCIGDMKPTVLSREVRSSSPKTKEKTIGVLEFSYKFGERFPVEAPLPLNSGVTVTGFAFGTYPPPTPRPQTAYQHNWANATPPPQPGRNFMERVVAGVTGSVIMSGFSDLGSGGDFTDA